MGMNLMVEASIGAVLSNGEGTIVREPIYVWETPTAHTKRIVRHEDPLRAYSEWARGIGEEEETVEAHIADLKRKIDRYTSEGWTITYGEI